MSKPPPALKPLPPLLPDRRRNQLAVVSLVLAVCGFIPLSLGFAIGAYRQISRGMGTGKGLLAASLVACGMWVALIAVGAVVFSFNPLSPRGQEGRDNPVLRLNVGACFDRATGHTEWPPRSIVGRSCDAPHDAEVTVKLTARSDGSPNTACSALGAGVDQDEKGNALQFYDIHMKQLVPGLVSRAGEEPAALCVVKRKDDGPLTEPFHHWQALLELETGACFDGLTRGQTALTVVSVRPCDSAHNAEVIQRLDLPASAWQGDKKLDEQAEKACRKRLSDFSWQDAEGKPLVLYSLHGDQATWQRGVRTALCASTRQDDTKLTAPYGKRH